MLTKWKSWTSRLLKAYVTHPPEEIIDAVSERWNKKGGKTASSIMIWILTMHKTFLVHILHWQTLSYHWSCFITLRKSLDYSSSFGNTETLLDQLWGKNIWEVVWCFFGFEKLETEHTIKQLQVRKSPPKSVTWEMTVLTWHFASWHNAFLQAWMTPSPSLSVLFQLPYCRNPGDF